MSKLPKWMTNPSGVTVRSPEAWPRRTITPQVLWHYDEDADVTQLFAVDHRGRVSKSLYVAGAVATEGMVNLDAFPPQDEVDKLNELFVEEPN
ncbi:MAG TPA: hypothetical protein VG604_04685 [Candidatus Saccharimonadales bacterium]|nr:hypothetical protein [Candidatus Saccharimonadales bacterium]